MGVADDVLPYFLYAFGGLDGITRTSDVIYSFKENDILDPVVAEEVARVAALPGRAQAAAQHAVAAEAEIQHGDIHTVGQKVARELIGPAVLAVCGGAASVGDGVTEHGDGR